MTESFVIPKNKKIGFFYFFKGLKICLQPGLKRYVLIPIIINFIILIALLLGAYNFVDSTVESWVKNVSWLSYISWLIQIIVFIITGVIMLYIYSFFALTIGSPFYTILSEKVEQHLNTRIIPETPFSQTLKEIPATIKLEFVKFVYRIPLLILSVIVFFIPFIGQILCLLIGSWCYGMDCTSYVYENNHIPFKDTRKSLLKHKMLCLTFGITVWCFMLIPFLNLFIIPISICGGTALWHDCLRHDFPQLPKNNL
ncbi:MAG: sulfate transporter CysZ [Succinivibrionaceae bacterium]